MEDRSIAELEQVALDYADIRDRRQALTRDEVELKARTKKLMHQYGKDHYQCDGVEISLVPGEEDVKVKVKREKDEDDQDAAEA